MQVTQFESFVNLAQVVQILLLLKLNPYEHVSHVVVVVQETQLLIQFTHSSFEKTYPCGHVGILHSELFVERTKLPAHFMHIN